MIITITMSILSACMFAIAILCYLHDRSTALMSARIYRALARAREEEQRA